MLHTPFAKLGPKNAGFDNDRRPDLRAPGTDRDSISYSGMQFADQSDVTAFLRLHLRVLARNHLFVDSKRPRPTAKPIGKGWGLHTPPSLVGFALGGAV